MTLLSRSEQWRHAEPGARAHLVMALVLLFAFVTLIASPAHVSAHASLLGTDPVDGAVLDGAPEQVTLSYSEPVTPVDDGFRLFDGDGLIDTLEAETAGTDVVLVMPGDLANGSHALSWRVISADGHPIQGTLLFSIGEQSGAPTSVPEDAEITPVVSVVQGLAYGGLLAAVGLLLFRALVTGDVRVDRRPAVIASVVAVIGHLLLIPLSTLRGEGRPLGDLFEADAWNGGTDSTTVTVALIVAITLFAAVTATWAESAAWRFSGVVAGSIGAMITLPMVGHTRTGDFSIVLSGIDVLHGLAAAVWFGGLIGLARYLRREGPDDPLASARVVSRFSTLAGVVFALAAASGVYLAYRYLDSLDALLDTTYGWLLIAKVAVVLIPFGLAAWNRLSLVPSVERKPEARSAWRRLRGVVLAEVALLIVVVGITGFLVLQSPTGDTTSAESAVATEPYEEMIAFEGGTLDVRLTPGASGINEMVVEARDDSGAPIELENPPGLTFSLPEQGLGPISVSLNATDTPGVYAGEVMIPLSGEWEMLIGMRLSRFEQATVTIMLDIP